MKSVAPPHIDAQSAYTRIATARRPTPVRERLLAAAPSVFAAYGDYTGSPDRLVTLTRAATPPATADDLQRNYDSRSSAARALKGAVFDHNSGGRCCLCGQARAATLDHYLPRTRYPEFAILPLNLIPSCWPCNNAKGTMFIEGAAAVFLHGYLDALPTQERFLFADVALEQGGVTVTFRVEPPTSMGTALATRIRTHFSRLALANYYLVEGVNELVERRTAVAELLGAGASADEVQAYLEREARSVAAGRGVNYWRYALLDGLAHYEPFCRGEAS